MNYKNREGFSVIRANGESCGQERCTFSESYYCCLRCWSKGLYG